MHYTLLLLDYHKDEGSAPHHRLHWLITDIPVSISVQAKPTILCYRCLDASTLHPALHDTKFSTLSAIVP